MSAALKNKYIVRSRHSVLCQDKFVPVNPIESRQFVQKPFIHDDGEAEKAVQQNADASKL